MDLMRWNPFSELDHMLGRRGLAGNLDTGKLMSWQPAADISETAKEYLIKADLPEVKREDIELTVENGVITITGERRHETEEEDEKSHRTEKFFGRFTRSFLLPENVDVSKIKASQDNGVLTVRLPKAEPEQTKTRKVEIN